MRSLSCLRDAPSVRLHQFIVSAFSSDWRGGNPAAVCVLEQDTAGHVDDALLQAVATQNNLSETAFLVFDEAAVSHSQPMSLRWFTPKTEVDLCGHATLASAHVLFRHLAIHPHAKVCFKTRSGVLQARLDADGVMLSLPAGCPQPVQAAADWGSLMRGPKPQAVFAESDYLLIYDSEAEVQELAPDMQALRALDRRGVIVTAPMRSSADIDFVSRFFAPKVGVDEDPVTGSAHCQLIPYWSEVMKKTSLTAWQCSVRGGHLRGEWRDPWVHLHGQAVTFSSGFIDLGGLDGMAT